MELSAQNRGVVGLELPRTHAPDFLAFGAERRRAVSEEDQQQAGDGESKQGERGETHGQHPINPLPMYSRIQASLWAPPVDVRRDDPSPAQDAIL
jgi:hypothetical protein